MSSLIKNDHEIKLYFLGQNKKKIIKIILDLNLKNIKLFPLHKIFIHLYNKVYLSSLEDPVCIVGPPI